MKSLAERIKAKRKEKGLTMEALGKLVESSKFLTYLFSLLNFIPTKPNSNFGG